MSILKSPLNLFCIVYTYYYSINIFKHLNKLQQLKLVLILIQ